MRPGARRRHRAASPRSSDTTRDASTNRKWSAASAIMSVVAMLPSRKGADAAGSDRSRPRSCDWPSRAAPNSCPRRRRHTGRRRRGTVLPARRGRRPDRRPTRTRLRQLVCVGPGARRALTQRWARLVPVHVASSRPSTKKGPRSACAVTPMRARSSADRRATPETGSAATTPRAAAVCMRRG